VSRHLASNNPSSRKNLPRSEVCSLSISRADTDRCGASDAFDVKRRRADIETGIEAAAIERVLAKVVDQRHINRDLVDGRVAKLYSRRRAYFAINTIVPDACFSGPSTVILAYQYFLPVAREAWNAESNVGCFCCSCSSGCNWLAGGSFAGADPLGPSSS
jgi:hypothetical protein